MIIYIFMYPVLEKLTKKNGYNFITYISCCKEGKISYISFSFLHKTKGLT